MSIHAMRVIDCEPASWYLLEREGELFLDGNYAHGAVGYEFLLKLDADERARFASEGRTFLHQLAARVQDTVPIASGSSSPYAGRSLSAEYGQQVLAAVQAWQQARGQPGR